MFERFSERARQVVVLAQEESRELGHPYIGAEHLLLGVVRVDASQGLDERKLRATVVESLGPAGGPMPSQIPFTPGAKAALEHSLVIALERGKRSIEPAHVLLALLNDDGVAGILLRSGIPAEQVRAELATALAEDVADSEAALPVTVGDERLGDLGNPQTDLRMLRAILRRDGRVAGWLRTAGVDEAWMREFGGE